MSVRLGLDDPGLFLRELRGRRALVLPEIGEHVVEFTAVLPTGAEITCSPKKNADLFYAMISGLGMLGIFTSITLQMKRVHSGLMSIHAKPVHNLHEQLTTLLEDAPHYDYIVGWMDAISRGRSLGRGQIGGPQALR